MKRRATRPATQPKLPPRIVTLALQIDEAENEISSLATRHVQKQVELNKLSDRISHTRTALAALQRAMDKQIASPAIRT